MTCLLYRWIDNRGRIPAWVRKAAEESDGAHGHVGACDVMHDIPGCFCGYEGLREALDAIEKETK